jgi:hypothetical protein
MLKPITRTSWPGPDDDAFIIEWQKDLDPVSFLPEAVEGDDQQLAWALNYLGEKLSELERYVSMIKLCNRNEMLFQKVLVSEQIRFLLSSDCRRRLYEMQLPLRSFERTAHFDPSPAPNSAFAA